MAVFSLWNTKGYFDTIPTEIEEAAQNRRRFRPADRHSKSSCLWQSPASSPPHCMVLIYVWNEYIYATTFLTGESKYTLAAGLNALQATEMTGSWPVFAAAAISRSRCPCSVIFFLCQRHMTSGLTAGGVKG
ncbi:MAG: hypothetical protein ACLTSG_06025 [Lachnospiraceae bacterium]